MLHFSCVLLGSSVLSCWSDKSFQVSIGLLFLFFCFWGYFFFFSVGLCGHIDSLSCGFFVTVELLMSLAIGFVSGTKGMGFDGDGEDRAAEASKTKTPAETDDESEPEGMVRPASESSICATEDEEDDVAKKIALGPQCTIKEHLEKDKDDESLRRWKEQLLGSVDITSVGESLEPDVKILSLAIKSPGRSAILLSVPENGNPKRTWFTLKEGSRYSLQFSFQVNNNIVLGLRYTNTVWKTGVKVDNAKEMLGTFSPQSEPYTHEMPEETTPSGMFARGSYTARTKFIDDDNKCYLEINYSFDIRKEWRST